VIDVLLEVVQTDFGGISARGPELAKFIVTGEWVLHIRHRDYI
jgi:hypothetical protein